jgi:hypothetical protein
MFLAVDPPAADREGHELDLTVDIEPPQGVLNVISYRRVRQIQARRDFEGRVPVGQERDDLVLPLRQGAGDGYAI